MTMPTVVATRLITTVFASARRGSSSELYDAPATPFVRDFLGQTVLLPGTVADARDPRTLGIAIGQNGSSGVVYSHRHSLPAPTAGQPASLSIRPEDIRVVDLQDAAADRPNCLVGTINALLFVGEHYEARITLASGESTILHLPRSQPWTEGQAVQLQIPAERAHLWPA